MCYVGIVCFFSSNNWIGIGVVLLSERSRFKAKPCAPEKWISGAPEFQNSNSSKGLKLEE